MNVFIFINDLFSKMPNNFLIFFRIFSARWNNLFEGKGWKGKNALRPISSEIYYELYKPGMRCQQKNKIF